MARQKRLKLFQVVTTEETATQVTWHVTARDEDDARDKFHKGERALVGRGDEQMVEMNIESIEPVKAAAP